MKQYEIIYHTKYKRIRRGAVKRSGKKDDEMDEDEGLEEEQKEESNVILGGNAADEPTVLLDEPDRITFEWIRLDPDNMWVCHKTFEQEDFMWNSLLRQDKDIISQYEAVIALGKVPSPATCATLMWILKDPSFFYRIRMEAAYALTKFDTPELDFVGLTNLLKILKDHYCMSSEQLIPKRNNFDDLQDYFLYSSIVTSIARFRDNKGWSPTICRSVLINLLRFNDNTGNKMSDSNWICMLIDLIGESFLVRPKNADDLSMMLSDRVHYKEAREIREEDVEEFDLPTYTREFSHRNAEIVKLHFADEDHALLALALDEVMQALRRDRFAGSRNNLVTVTCLELLTKWQIAGLVEPNIAIFLSYSRHGHFPSIRRMAIESLILLSGLETIEMTRYLCHLCIDDPDPYIRYTTSIAMMNAVALACQQIRTIARPESRKQILRTQVLAMMDVWSPISPERFDFHVYRYLAKIVELAREIITDESRLVVKMPIKALAESTLSQIADESVVPDFQPALKPLKLSFKGLGATPASKKFAADDLRPKIMKKLLAQKAANWFLDPVDPVAFRIPTYFEVIKRPMDLGMVKKKLDAGEYDGDEDFAAD
ncbi:hypothetical protein HDU91_001357, partial [Kappamyces sp. JEL0680]